jgi:hypothetical protein
MGVERWGAFSVVDHKDVRKLAADVLLYDRLVLPTPPAWDLERWNEQKWDPSGLEERLKQLGELAVRATWDLNRHKQWSEKFHALRDDVRDMNAALHISRRVLVEHGRDYRPPGVGAVEVVAAFQSEADFAELDGDTPPQSSERAELDFLLAHCLAVPDGDNAEESLKRALDLCSNDKFVNRRRRFHEWQRRVVSDGVRAEDAVADLERLVREYNEAVQKTKGSFRLETAMLVGGLSAAALATFAGAAPAAVAALGFGALKGAQVVSIGNAAVGAILQVVRHGRSRKDPDGGAVGFSGAMFHQIETELGWRLRAEPRL